MNIETIKENIAIIQDKISNLNMMIEDYDHCSSETSKKVLEAAIVKIGKFLVTSDDTASNG